MMAVGVKRAESYQVCPAARQTAWMTSLSSLAVRSCRSALRVEDWPRRDAELKWKSERERRTLRLWRS